MHGNLRGKEPYNYSKYLQCRPALVVLGEGIFEGYTQDRVVSPESGVYFGEVAKLGASVHIRVRLLCRLHCSPTGFESLACDRYHWEKNQW